LKKQQFLLVTSGAILLCLIYFFGRTLPAKNISNVASRNELPANTVNIQTILEASKKQLTADQQAHVGQLENAVVRGDVKNQQIGVYKQLASFWKDSAHLLLPYGYYTGEAAKLENSEKSLTFAAHFFLDGVRGQEDLALKRWMADEARQLFERALILNPGNDSLKVGLGSCYLFGNISETPMKGIQMIREVADRDPENMYAQFMLGIGGMISGQLDKAIERLSKVATRQPGNPEVLVILAEAYERKGDKTNAIKWYEAGRSLIKNPDIIKEIDQRITSLKK
jgi:predicted Zn-dependent protease